MLHVQLEVVFHGVFVPQSGTSYVQLQDAYSVVNALFALC